MLKGGITWNYRNRLTKSVTGGTNTLYTYDHNNDRIGKGNGIATTTYPNRYYNVSSATTTKHIFSSDGTLIGTIEKGTGSATTTNYIHTDHLGGTNVVTDSTGGVVQTLDYYPFGSLRVDNSTLFDEIQKFTGHEFDREADLTYAKARYYDQDTGKFLSQDPASRDNPAQFLLDPQQLNYYAYGRNNPLILVDRNGRKVELVARSINTWFTPLQAGLHAYLLITPDEPDKINDLGGTIKSTENFTLGGYRNTQANTLRKGINDSSDNNYKSTKYGGSTEIKPPEGKTDTQFINDIIAAYENYPDNALNYRALGNQEGKNNGNSNNLVTRFLQDAGVNSKTVKQFDPRGYSPGLGTPTPNRSVDEKSK